MPARRFRGLTPAEVLAVKTGPKRIAVAWRILDYVEKTKGTTCHECLEGIGIAYQTGSPRYHELVRAGCLVPTGQRRTTSQGGMATVHRLAPKVDFKKFLNLPKRSGKDSGDLDKEIVRVGQAFLRRWRKAKTHKGRESAAVALVQAMVGLRKLT